jgi:hypothetical protein
MLVGLLPNVLGIELGSAVVAGAAQSHKNENLLELLQVYLTVAIPICHLAQLDPQLLLYAIKSFVGVLETITVEEILI